MKKTLSIIIPSYNEEKTIIKILEKIDSNKIELINFEIIVIDDGSSDQSRKVLESNKDLYNKLLINERNLGKGFSVKKGIDVFAGVIDSGYRGVVKVCLYNSSFENVDINRHDRIAQIIFQEIPSFSIEETETLNESPRSTEGFGSTGK